MLIGRSKQQVFGYIKAKVQDKLQGWKRHLLSPARKAVLIKSVAMALPTYTMSCFKLPKVLCKDVGKMVAKFWWGNGESKRRMHWTSWEKMSHVKGRGGLGVRDIEKFNDAFLAKQLWRMLTQPNLLVSRVMRSKYLGRAQDWDKDPPKASSWIWKSLMGTRKLLNK